MEIPNGEVLYRYASPSAFPVDQKEIPSSVFNDPDLSCDWRHFRNNPLTSPHVAAGRSVVVYITVCDEIKNPGNNRGAIPAWKQDVIHDPLDENDPDGPNEAHSLIRGPKKLAVLEALRKNSSY